MNAYSQGTLRKKHAPYKTQDGTRKMHWVWQMVITFTDDEGKQHVRRKDTAIECSPDSKDRKRGTKTKAVGKGSDRALQELAAWRQSLIEEDKRAEAQAEAEAQAKAEEERKASDPARGMFADYVDSYIERRAKGQCRGLKRIEESTKRAYKGSARYIRNAWGDKAICEVTDEAVLDLQDKLINEGKSPSTVVKVHRLLTLVCNDLISRKVIHDDFMRNVKPPKLEPKNPNAYGSKDVPLIAERLELLPPSPCVMAANLCFFLGLRRGEVAAIRWEDILFDSNQVHVCRAVGVKENGESYEKAPKTAFSDRKLDMPQQLRTALERWHAENLRDAMKMGINDISLWHVCGKPDGTGYDPIALSYQWTQLSRAFGIKGTNGTYPRLVDLRHTFASTLSKSGVPIKTAAHMMGHSNPSTMLKWYVDANDEDSMREATEAINVATAHVPADVVTLRTGTDA